jgi:type IV secretory pathway VirB10-like protein
MARRKKTTEEQPVENTTSQADENFGLPDIEYTPLDRNAPEPVVESTSTPVEEKPVESQTYQTRYEEKPVENTYESSYSYTESSASGTSIWPKIIAIAIVVLLALGAAWYFVVYKPKKEMEEKVLAEQRRKKAELEEEQRRIAEEQRLAEERRRAEEAAKAKPAEGSIETLSERTQRYYVVVASSIDGDLIMDYAKKLSAKGVSCKIIPPYGKIKFSRLAIAEGDNYPDTQKVADGMKGEYGDALWVIKY